MGDVEKNLNPRMTIAQHVAAVRHHKDGMRTLVAALRDDPALTQEANQKLKDLAEMERAGRLEACWISRLTKQTLTAALAGTMTEPGVPAGGKIVGVH